MPLCTQTQSSTPIKAWYNDGTVIYGSYEHLTLMIVTSIIVGALLIPYLIILIGGKGLMKSGRVREYLRPIYETIHAPYKDNKKILVYCTIASTPTHCVHDTKRS